MLAKASIHGRASGHVGETGTAVDAGLRQHDRRLAIVDTPTPHP